MQDDVLTTDFSGRIKSVNLAAQTMLGYTEQEMLGQNMTTYITGLNEDDSVIYASLGKKTIAMIIEKMIVFSL